MGLAVLLAAAAWLPQGACAREAVRVIDDRGREITLPGPAARIVSLAPHLTELAFAAGAGEKLVGVSAFSDYPSAAKTIEVVGDAASIDVERVLKLKPDLIIAWRSGNRPGDIARLEKLGLRCYVAELKRLADIPRALRIIGKLAGTEAAAERAASVFEHDLADLAKRYRGGRPVSVFFEIWHRPLMTVNGEHMISDVISLCGGSNLFARASTLAPAVSMENVLAANPEVIVATDAAYLGPDPWADWRRFPQLLAVRKHRLFPLPPEIIERQTPRILQGVRALCERLQAVREDRD